MPSLRQAAAVFATSLGLCMPGLPAIAEEPVIEQVRVARDGQGLWRFDVTIRHPDTGWDHYADGWRILDMDGNELGMRVLLHPHVNEQPFTRSLSGVEIPVGTEKVLVRGQDNQHGYGPEIELELERPD
jgi:hypothetical protein